MALHALAISDSILVSRQLYVNLINIRCIYYLNCAAPLKFLGVMVDFVRGLINDI